MSEPIDIGHGHTLTYFSWSPDRELNPQYDGIPDIEKAGCSVAHPSLKDGSECMSAINFDTVETRKLWPNEKNLWKVESREPLTVSPSLLCMRCGDHGFILGGKWVPA